MKIEAGKPVPSRCGNCEYFEQAEVKETSDVVGECKRMPPVTIVTQDGACCVYPSVSRLDWCGEFQVRKDA